MGNYTTEQKTAAFSESCVSINNSTINCSKYITFIVDEQTITRAVFQDGSFSSKKNIKIKKINFLIKKAKTKRMWFLK